MCSAIYHKFGLVAACLVLVLLGMVRFIETADVVDHCSQNNFRSSWNTTHMQYTKEPVHREYAVLDQFKSLHCCAKGYTSIEWFKDGKPYPFPGLILYPEEANQTIYTREVTMGVAGNYTCVLRNDTHKMENHIELIVKSSAPATPLATFQPQNIEELHEGETARFYCEAFVSDLRLPNGRSEISWHRVNKHGQWQRMPSVVIVNRTDDYVLGAILNLVAVREDDYGAYVCRIMMSDASNFLEMKVSLHISPTVARTVSNVHILSTVAAILAAFLIVLFICVVFLRRHHARRHKMNSLPHREHSMYDTATIEMSFKHPHQPSSSLASRA